MILSICPNPSIDCTIELDTLNVGKLNRTRNKIETYSGKALNVAKGIARLGERVVATGFMFEDHAKLFEHVLEKEGVEHKFIYNEGSARVNYKIIDKRSMLTEINDRGETVDKNNQAKLISLVKDLSTDSDIVVMSGSLPKGVNAEFYADVLKVVEKRSKIIVDTEKDNMNAVLNAGINVFMVKPNLTELEGFVGGSLNDKIDMVRASRKYIDRGVQNVMVSLGSEGALLTDGSRHFYCKSANVAVNSTVGAGDSMVAAACVGLYNGVSKEVVLKMSVAAGTAAITTSGTNLFYKDKFDEIYKKIYVEEIKL